MANLNEKLLAEICEAPGVPGHEQKIRDIVRRELDGLGFELSVDNMGNLTAFKAGKDARNAMVAAHMDEIGFIVTHIDDNGFLKFHPLGGFDPKTLTAQRVIVHTESGPLVGVMGSKPIHVMSPEERNKGVKIKDFFIDLGLEAEEVKKKVEVGNTVTRERELIKMGHCFNCKSLDNRVSVFILVEALKNLAKKELPVNLHGVFTVQEEVGLRGAHAATLRIKPTWGIGLDTTIAFDVPGAAGHEKITELGKGVAIKILDGSVISDVRMVKFLKAIADKQKITWQPEILTAGGTDTAALQKFTEGGSIAGAISIPTRHIHQVIEMVHEADVTAAIKLLEASILNLGKEEDWAIN
ncbi:M42 family metallopeptidase [Luteibaculum oceani]|uniref:M42 family metallopeptidase n=1 Tax=Luteibaculum oceani TaxID=1294296 RepID=A0A5C6VK22_9FLAO|nr:M42 family metallopeptidase [Luteibaculum oceani]TXC85410.1 M42 family metallopeptidase [Luteibaculum oceani]